MRATRTMMVAAVAALLCSAVPVRAQVVSAGTHENHTAGASATALLSATQANAMHCEGVVETAQFRFLVDGGTPTASIGTLVNPGDTIVLGNAADIRNYKDIRTTSTSGVVNFQCSQYASPVASTVVRGFSGATAFNLSSTFNASASATPTLLASKCGQMFAMDRASGTNYTLPVPPGAGCTFDFLYTVAQTSGTNEIQTSGGTVFLVGQPIVSGTTTAGFPCNGTSHVSIKSNDTTTGGLVGGHLKFTSLSATLWDVQGTLVGSGTVATPCSTTP